MGICPNCGSWVDEGDICMGCGGTGGYNDDPEPFDPVKPFILPTESRLGLTLNETQIEAYVGGADYYTGFKDEYALEYINSALELDNKIPENLCKKGVILKNLKRFEESEEYFNRALELSHEVRHWKVYDEKARMFYDWSSQLIKESGKLSSSEALNKLKEAKMKIERAINFIPKCGYEKIEKYLKKIKEIESWEYSTRAWTYYNDYKDEDALYYIDLALDLDDNISSNWNRKGIILECLERFEESEKCYKRSLRLSESRIVFDNKVRMLYDWSDHLIKEAEKLSSSSERSDKLKEAKNVIERAIYNFPKNSEEDIEKYINRRDEIDLILDGELKVQRNIESLKSYDKSELFTITGTYFYKSNLKPGWPLKLVKEPHNEYDRDAIAVYAYGEKIGYVANNYDTRYELTSSASELQDKIDDITKGVYLFSLEGIACSRTFHIGRIIY